MGRIGNPKGPRIRKPTKAEMEENWKSKDPKELAYEIATFMGGTWPERPVRKVRRAPVPVCEPCV